MTTTRSTKYSFMNRTTTLKSHLLINIEKTINRYMAEFKGWIKGKDTRRERYLTDFGYKHRPEVYCFPFSELQHPNYFPLEAPQI